MIWCPQHSIDRVTPRGDPVHVLLEHSIAILKYKSNLYLAILTTQLQHVFLSRSLP